MIIIVKEISHFQKYNDWTGLKALLIQSSSNDFSRFQQIIESATNVKIVGEPKYPKTLRIVREGKVKTNEVYQQLVRLEKKGNISFRSVKLNNLVGEGVTRFPKNFDVIRSIEKLIDNAKAANEPVEVIQALQVCWVKIKST